jgi:hypothetical protein
MDGVEDGGGDGREGTGVCECECAGNGCNICSGAGEVEVEWDLQRDLMLGWGGTGREAGVAGEGRNICSGARVRETALAGRACLLGARVLELDSRYAQTRRKDYLGHFHAPSRARGNCSRLIAASSLLAVVCPTPRDTALREAPPSRRGAFVSEGWQSPNPPCVGYTPATASRAL